jgi:hypothetical protein
MRIYVYYRHRKKGRGKKRRRTTRGKKRRRTTRVKKGRNEGFQLLAESPSTFQTFPSRFFSSELEGKSVSFILKNNVFVMFIIAIVISSSEL